MLLRETADPAACMKELAGRGLSRSVSLPVIRGFSCLADEQGNRLLQQHPDVKRVEHDQPVTLAATVVRSTHSIRNAARLPVNIRAIRAHQAWDKGRGEGVAVAFFDTGIDPTHPDLAPNYGGGINLIAPGSLPLDDHGHGTKVAGIIAAVGRMGSVVGVAPRARLYAVKVLDARGDGSLSAVLRGLQWVVDNKIPLVNMSLDIPEESEALRTAIRKAVASGVTIVASTGNGGRSHRITYPAAYPEVIAVSAVSADGQPVSFCNTGPEVDLVAPGLGIHTTAPQRGYTWASGTSMACSHVTGVAALYLQNCPTATPEQVKQALKATATALPDLTEEQQGAGLVDAWRTVCHRETKPEKVGHTGTDAPLAPQTHVATSAQEPLVAPGKERPQEASAWEDRLVRLEHRQEALERLVAERLGESAGQGADGGSPAVG